VQQGPTSGPFGKLSVNYGHAIGPRTRFGVGVSIARFEPEREHLTYWDGSVSANMSPRFDGIGALGVFGSVTARAPNSAAKSSETHHTSRFMTIKQPTAGSRSRSLISPDQAVDRAADYMFINLFKKVLWLVGD
jgi:hypothetical protein